MYILHGPRVDATTDGSGNFHELTSAQIDALDAGSWFGADHAGERVPRLEEFLRWIKGKAQVFLDVKRADHEQLIGLLDSLGMAESVFFWSGRPGWQQRLRELRPDMKQKLNISSTRSTAENERAKRGVGVGEGGGESAEAKLAGLVAQLETLQAEYGSALFAVEIGLSDFRVAGVQEACRERGVRCMVMHCPETPDREGFREIIRGGADMVNLDDADVFLEVAAEEEKKAAAL